MNTLVVWLLALGVGVSSLVASRSLMHYFQLESYQFAGYFRTLKRNFLRAMTPGAIMTVYLLLLLLIGLISGAAGIIFSRWAYVKFVAVPPEILDSTLLYYRIYCAGLIFQFAYNSLAAILRSVGDSAATLYCDADSGKYLTKE